MSPLSDEERRNERVAEGKRVRSWINIFNYRAWFRVEVSKKHKESRSALVVHRPSHGWLLISPANPENRFFQFPLLAGGGEFSRSNFVILSFHPPVDIPDVYRIFKQISPRTGEENSAVVQNPSHTLGFGFGHIPSIPLRYIILISVENFDKFFTISRFAVEDDRDVESFGGRNKSIGESLSYSGKDIEKYQLRFPGKNDSTWLSI